ncbi:MAG: acyl-protein synthetase [Polyangiaceae bacterium]|nr:acyl-protein synthetase [Polyangiaceae bacterium]
MIAHDESDALHARVQALLPTGAFDERLTLDIARFQASHTPPIGRLYAARGLRAATMARVDDLPGVPTDAWKRVRLAAHPASDDAVVFLTSGTTSGARGAHPLRRVDTYDAAALSHARRMLALDAPHVCALLLLDDPSSSLGHMGRALAGALASRTIEGFRRELDVDALLSTSRSELPVVLMATSFALVHALDALGARRCPLPPGSRVMQTGGFKGKSREVPPEELRAAVSRAFGVPERQIVSEYGMTELGSQAYEATILDPGARHGELHLPAWCRVSAVDPGSDRPLPLGEPGLLRFVDPVNVDSAIVVQTQDLGRALSPTTFELHGRLPGALPRGCSLAIEELVGR